MQALHLFNQEAYHSKLNIEPQIIHQQILCHKIGTQLIIQIFMFEVTDQILLVFRKFPDIGDTFSFHKLVHKVAKWFSENILEDEGQQ